MLFGLKEFLIGLCPRRNRYCRLSEKEKTFAAARNLLEKETNINSIVKNQRFFKLALKLLVPKAKLRALKIESRYKTVFPGGFNKDNQAREKSVMSDTHLIKQELSELELDSIQVVDYSQEPTSNFKVSNREHHSGAFTTLGRVRGTAGDTNQATATSL